MSRDRYIVQYVRDDKWWPVLIPEISGCYTQARDLQEVEFMARDAVSLMLEVETGSFDLELAEIEEWPES